MKPFLGIIKYFWEKFLLTIPLGVFVLKDDHYAVIYGLAMMIIIDSFLGIWVSIKYKTFASHRLRQIANKISIYGLSMMSVWILCSVSPMAFGWSFSFFGTFLILTELFSNFEKLSLLGLRIPTLFLSKLNTSFNEYYYGDKKQKEKAVKNILDKNIC